MRLAGKVALITGGATGIGRAAVRRFASEGAAVVIADFNEAEGRAAAAEVEERGGEALFVPCDVTREADVQRVLSAVRERFARVDVLVTSAGILLGAFQLVEEVELESFDRVLRVNVLGTFLFCKHTAPLMKEAGRGAVLCIASGAGVRGPSSSLAYGASKASVQGFCHTLERQLAPHGIRVHVVCPGVIDTPLKRQNVRDGALAHGKDPEEALASARLGDPDGVAKILAFLASDESEYLLGTVFTR